jgi:hypothetical protein
MAPIGAWAVGLSIQTRDWRFWLDGNWIDLEPGIKVHGEDMLPSRRHLSFYQAGHDCARNDTAKTSRTATDL